MKTLVRIVLQLKHCTKGIVSRMSQNPTCSSTGQRSYFWPNRSMSEYRIKMAENLTTRVQRNAE
jgi:hypothetical protein